MQADAELLAAFRADRSEAAFAEIMARHGGMVWRTALRSLGDAQEAEDAAQAAFLMLAQKPESVVGPLATWLYYAARKTAFVARRSRQRRSQREEAAAIMPAIFPTLDGELREEIDAALELLPETLREAVILCHLEGCEQTDAARQAGCSQATISRRSTEGLQQLGAILRRRGITAGAIVVAGFLAAEASAAPPASLNAAHLLGRTPPAAATTLAKSAWQSIFWARMQSQLAAAGFLLTLVIITGVALLAWPEHAPISTPSAVSARPAPVVVFLPRERAVFDHSDRVISVAFSPDGKTLASGGADRRIQLYESLTGRVIAFLSGHRHPVKCVAFSPDGITLASGDTMGEIKLWNVASGSERTTLRPKGTINTIAFAPDGRTLAIGFHNGAVELWDLREAKRRAVLSGHKDMVHCLAFSADGKTLATGSRDRTVRLWDVVTGQQQQALKHADAVCAVAFTPDGKTLIAGSGRSIEEVWSAMTVVPEKTPGKQGAVTIWNALTGQQQQTIPAQGYGVYSLAVSPNGKLLAVGGGDALVKLWTLEPRQELTTLTGHAALVRSLVFAPDGRTLASASHDLTVRLWDVAPRK